MSSENFSSVAVVVVVVAGAEVELIGWVCLSVILNANLSIRLFVCLLSSCIKNKNKNKIMLPG